MSTNTRPLAASSSPQDRSYFEQQRDLLLQEIGISFEHVLANINKLNRSLEAVTAVGNEFSGVEALWSRFESVMGKGGGEATSASAGGVAEGSVREGDTEVSESSVAGGEEGEGREEDSTVLEGSRRR